MKKAIALSSHILALVNSYVLQTYITCVRVLLGIQTKEVMLQNFWILHCFTYGVGEAICR